MFVRGDDEKERGKREKEQKGGIYTHIIYIFTLYYLHYIYIYIYQEKKDISDIRHLVYYSSPHHVLPWLAFCL